jgi:hypothetical protein
MEEPTQQSKEKTEKPSTSLQEPKKTRLDIKGGLITFGMLALWISIGDIGSEILHFYGIGYRHNLRLLFVVLWAILVFWWSIRSIVKRKRRP